MLTKLLVFCFAIVLATQALAGPFAKYHFIYGTANGIPMVIESSTYVDNFVAGGWLHGVACSNVNFAGKDLYAEVDLRNKTLTLSREGGDPAISVGALLVQNGQIGGMQVLKLHTKMTIDGKPLELIGEVSVDPLNDFHIFRGCPDAGWEPGLIEALATIKDRAQAIAWLASKGWRQNALYWEEDKANLIFVSVPVGFEYDAIADISRQTLFLDAARVGIDAGPSDVTLEFPMGSLLTKSTTIESIRLKVAGIANELVKSENAIIGAITVGNGYTYTLNIESPVTPLGIKGFEGWWLKFKLNLLFDREIEPDSTSSVDRITIQIPDGYLAKWPEDRKVPPPMGHYDHLDEEGDGRFKSFMLLQAVQEHVANQLRTAWRQ